MRCALVIYVVMWLLTHCLVASSAEAAKRKKGTIVRRAVPVRPPPLNKRGLPVAPSHSSPKHPPIKVAGTPTNVRVEIYPQGYYVASCVAGTVRGIGDQRDWQPQTPIIRSVRCLSMWDRRTQLSFTVWCAQGYPINESTLYEKDNEFILRLSCHST